MRADREDFSRTVLFDGGGGFAERACCVAHVVYQDGDLAGDFAYEDLRGGINEDSLPECEAMEADHFRDLTGFLSLLLLVR